MAKFLFGNGVVQRLFSGWRLGEPARRPGLLVVRRGMSPAFHFFCEVLANQCSCVVVEDRRQGGRRHRQGETVVERRHRDERRRADFRAEDFWIIGGDRISVNSVPRREPNFVLPFPRALSAGGSAAHARKSH